MIGERKASVCEGEREFQTLTGIEHYYNTYCIEGNSRC